MKAEPQLMQYELCLYSSVAERFNTAVRAVPETMHDLHGFLRFLRHSIANGMEDTSALLSTLTLVETALDGVMDTHVDELEKMQHTFTLERGRPIIAEVDTSHLAKEEKAHANHQ